MQNLILIGCIDIGEYVKFPKAPVDSGPDSWSTVSTYPAPHQGHLDPVEWNGGMDWRNSGMEVG